MRDPFLTVTERASGDEVAQHLANRLSLPLNAGQASYSLKYNREGLLALTELASGLSVVADFSSPRMVYRLAQGLRREMLIRAVGVKPGDSKVVVDATAGLGQDAFLLAAAGCQVLMVERSAVVHALLESALEKAKTSDDESIREISSRMSLLQGDSVKVLGSHFVSGCPTDSDRVFNPAVVYLDPMFAARKKSARVKKGMFLLHDIVGHGDDIQDGVQLLSAALGVADERVVVKRPRLAHALGGRAPHWQYTGRSSRFDVYRSMRSSTSS